MVASRLTLALVAASLLLGCGDATGPDRDPAGTYALESVNAQPLPFTDTDKTVILSGSLVLKSNRTFTLSGSVRSGSVTQTSSIDGTYSQNGSTITFHVEDELTNADYTGDKITFDDGQDRFVYHRP